jgi:hypothetical protein
MFDSEEKMLERLLAAERELAAVSALAVRYQTALQAIEVSTAGSYESAVESAHELAQLGLRVPEG